MTSFSPIRYFDRQTQNLKDKQTEMRSLTDMLAMKRKEKKRKENRRDAYLRGEEEAKRNRNWRWGGRAVAAFVSWKRRRKEGGRLGCLPACLLCVLAYLLVGWTERWLSCFIYIANNWVKRSGLWSIHPLSNTSGNPFFMSSCFLNYVFLVLGNANLTCLPVMFSHNNLWRTKNINYL